jgi:hypothetical protein
LFHVKFAEYVSGKQRQAEFLDTIRPLAAAVEQRHIARIAFFGEQIPNPAFIVRMNLKGKPGELPGNWNSRGLAGQKRQGTRGSHGVGTKLLSKVPEEINASTHD